MASVGSILGGAFRLFRERPAAILIWAAVYFAAAIVMAMLMSWFLTGTVSIVTNPAALMPQRPGAMPPGFWQVMLFIYPFTLVLFAVQINAVFRAVLRPEDSGFASLRLGMDELRTIGLAVIVVIVGFIAMFIVQLLLMLAVTFIGMVSGGGAAGAALASILMIACFCGWIWLWVRLSLLFPLTFHRRKISVDAAWDLARGRFWTLFGAYFIVLLMMFLLIGAAVWVMMGDYIAAIWAAQGNEEQMQRAIAEFTARQVEMPVAMRVGQMLINSLIGIIALALGCGTIASATRELLIERGEDERQTQDWSEAEI